MVDSHKQLLRAGILGDSSERFRVINKGRQEGFSIFNAIESISIAKFFPYTNQFYVATKEKAAKEWLEKVEQISYDSRVLIDGSRIIDIDNNKSTIIRKAFRHAPKDIRKKIGYSYIAGLAASPRERGMTGLNVIIDEFDHMNKEKDLQVKIWTSLKPVLSQSGSQCTIQSTPQSKAQKFWQIYTTAKRIGFTPYYFPVITNWREIDLSLPLTEQELNIPYYWIDVNELEMERLDDIEFFKQERLGIPADVLHRYITPELLEASAQSRMMRVPQGRPYLSCAIDVASEVDVTAVTLGEDINHKLYERNLFSTSGDYPQQEISVLNFLRPYKPYLRKVRIDNTGIGKSLADYIKKAGYRIERINFQTTIETRASNTVANENKKNIRIGVFMAEQLKRSLEDGSYLTLSSDEPCQYIRQANNHTLNVEQLETTTTKEKRYSGKRNGRDDFFWSRAMLNTDFSITKRLSGMTAVKSQPMVAKQMRQKRVIPSIIRTSRNIKRRYTGW